MTSPITAPGTAATRADTRPGVTVLTGFRPEPTAAVATALAAADPTMLVVSHDVSRLESGLVRRLVTTATDTIEDATVQLDHGCLACTVRDDVLPTLARLAERHPDRDIALVIPSTLEPSALAAACAYCHIDGRPVTELVRLDSVVAVIDAATFLDDLRSDDDLSHRGLAAADNDLRTVADVAARQVEYADTVLITGDDGDFETTRLAVLVRRLAPWAVHVTDTANLRDTRRFDADTPEVFARGLEGYPIGVHDPNPDCGVSSLVFTSRRPFHPGRLHALLGTIADHTLRGRGHLWLASQPDHAVAWESAGGGLSMGSLGRWLASLPDEGWDEISPRRRVTADLEWDPYYGDRGVKLDFVGIDFDAVDLQRALQTCLLTDAELSTGEETWRTWHDPFAGCLDDPTDEPA